MPAVPGASLFVSTSQSGPTPIITRPPTCPPPALHSPQPSDVVFNFEIREDGLLDYDAFLDVILTGRDTTTLVVQPGEGGGT